MLNAKEFAAQVGRAHSTVLAWLRDGKVDGAVVHDTPRGIYYEVPESVAKSFQPPPMGRPWPKKEAETNSKTAKSKLGLAAAAAAQPALFETKKKGKKARG